MSVLAIADQSQVLAVAGESQYAAPAPARGGPVNGPTEGGNRDGGGGGQVLLSSAQIRPRERLQRVERGGPASLRFAHGGRFVKLHFPARGKLPRGGRRPIRGFTKASRRNLLAKLASIDRNQVDALRCYFVTLTYHKSFPSPRRAKRDLKVLLQRFRRAFGPVALAWKLEPQKRGAPHFHLAAFPTSKDTLHVQMAWWATAWNEVAAPGDGVHLAWHRGELGNQPCCELMRSWEGVMSYAGKYLAKVQDSQEQEGWNYPGRWWGLRDWDLLQVEHSSYKVADRAAFQIRRWLGKYVEHQPSGWVKIAAAGVSRKYFLTIARAKELTAIGLELRPLRRRVRFPHRSLRGFSAFVPGEVVQRMLGYWAAQIARIEDLDEDRKLSEKLLDRTT